MIDPPSPSLPRAKRNERCEIIRLHTCDVVGSSCYSTTVTVRGGISTVTGRDRRAKGVLLIESTPCPAGTREKNLLDQHHVRPVSPKYRRYVPKLVNQQKPLVSSTYLHNDCCTDLPVRHDGVDVGVGDGSILAAENLVGSEPQRVQQLLLPQLTRHKKKRHEDSTNVPCQEPSRQHNTTQGAMPYHATPRRPEQQRQAQGSSAVLLLSDSLCLSLFS